MGAPSRGGEPIVLIGFMATGKSTVGRLVSERLDRRFVDLDAAIEKSAGKSIGDIFRSEGEAGFRRWERLALQECLQDHDVVIATGGGAACQENNLADMLARGFVIALTAPAAEVIRRTGSASGRPLLDGQNDPESIAASLLREREPFYARAHLRVNTVGRSPDEVADEIMKTWSGGPRPSSFEKTATTATTKEN